MFIIQSDALSGIANCTLLINSTLNESNTTILENARLNFTKFGLPNGLYRWTVNCTDDSSNRNTGTGGNRLFTIAVDTTNPVVTPEEPFNNYTDTNLNVSFNYTLSDDLTGTADCALYINGTLNATQDDISTTDGGTKIFNNVSLFNNGTYNWYVNCSDDSLSRNYNISEIFNFTALEDLEEYVITIFFPAEFYQDTTGNVSFIYNVSDLITNISRCTLSINDTRNQTNFSVAENRRVNFTVNDNLNGYFNWSINCTDTSENGNVTTTVTRTFLSATDVDPPVVKLEFPPNNIELSNSTFTGINITFRYNVSDFASEINNCSLHINKSNSFILNATKKGILEDTSQNFTVNMSDGSTNGMSTAATIREIKMPIYRK